MVSTKRSPLLHDPYRVFHGSRTPPGLYARRKWLDEGHTLRWREDFHKTVADLFAGQAENGSWRDSPIQSIHRLFGLHLTVRETEPRIDIAMEWLLEKAAAWWYKADSMPIGKDQMRGLPFASTCRHLFFLPATLFLATVFGKLVENRITGLYDLLIERLSKRRESWQDTSEIHNIFRALVVHKLFSSNPLTSEVVNWMADRQTEEGDWGPDIPFFQALNALAHLNSPAVDSQLEKAFSLLFRTQQTDGTWGFSEKEWNTFLVVHALRQKHLI